MPLFSDIKMLIQVVPLLLRSFQQYTGLTVPLFLSRLKNSTFQKFNQLNPHNSFTSLDKKGKKALDSELWFLTEPSANMRSYNTDTGLEYYQIAIATRHFRNCHLTRISFPDD